MAIMKLSVHVSLVIKWGFGWTLGVGDGQGDLECCDSQGCKESDTTEQLNWLHYPVHLFKEIIMRYALAWVLSHFSHVQLFETLWTVACGAPSSMGSSRQKFCVGCHALHQGIFPTQGSNLCLLCLLYCKRILYPLSHLGSSKVYMYFTQKTWHTAKHLVKSRHV